MSQNLKRKSGRRTQNVEELLAAVREIASQPEAYPEARFVLDIISTGLKFTRDRPERGDLKMLTQAFKELRYGFKVFAPYRSVRKVAVFGSARTPKEEPAYEQAYAFANSMIKIGWMVVTGAGPGIMEAAQGGAGRAKSFGVNIRLPFESEANPVIADDPKLIHFKYFFTRKVVFVKETDAIALFPGGFGTLDEAYESLTLIQTGKSELLPLVFIDHEGSDYWQQWQHHNEKYLRDLGYIDPNDLSLFHLTDSIETATAIIRKFYSNYHSSRYLFERLVLRLHRPVTDALLDELNADFSDILKEGRFERVECHEYEAIDEPETSELHRLGFWFDRKSLGRLRLLVDRLNDEV